MNIPKPNNITILSRTIASLHLSRHTGNIDPMTVPVLPEAFPANSSSSSSTTGDSPSPSSSSSSPLLGCFASGGEQATCRRDPALKEMVQLPRAPTWVNCRQRSGPIRPHSQYLNQGRITKRNACINHYNYLEKLLQTRGYDYGRPEYITRTSTISISATVLQMAVHQPTVTNSRHRLQSTKKGPNKRRKKHRT